MTDPKVAEMLKHLKGSIQRGAIEKKKIGNVAAIRRYLIAASDILDIYLDFKRNRRWDKYDW